MDTNEPRPVPQQSGDEVPHVCPHGHGTLRLWNGRPRCWSCGWPWKVSSRSAHGIVDVFVSYSGGDFETYVRPLVGRLREAGLEVWLDKTDITWGDSVVGRVNEGLRTSRFVVLCLSRNFLERPWPEAELDAVIARQNAGGTQRILPLVLNSRQEVMDRYPLLAGLAARDYELGLDAIANELVSLVSGAVDGETIQVMIESVHTAKSATIRVNIRDSVEHLVNMAGKELGLKTDADVGAYRRLPVHWVLVDVRSENEWLTMERSDQQKTQAVFRNREGLTKRLLSQPRHVGRVTRLFEAGVQDQTLFHAYVIEDPDEPPPAAHV